MTVPLMILAVLSVVGGYVGLPAHWLSGNVFGNFLEPVFGATEGAHLSVGTEYTLMAASSAVALVGLAIAYLFYIKQPGLPFLLAYQAGRLYEIIYNKYYVDELYEFLFVRPTVIVSTWMWQVFDLGVIDGLVNGTAEAVEVNSGLWRRVQTGNAQQYAVSMLLGAMAILAYYAWR
jgi:NADH-quinone oxidoreductase subunit L